MNQLNLPPYNHKIITKDKGDYIFDIIRNKYISLTPEEWVRQNFISFLINEKSYPKGRIGNEISMLQNGIKRRADSVIYDIYGEPLMIIEYKAPEIKITRQVFEQIVRYNMVLRVKYLIVSNGLSHYCCKIDYSTNKINFLKEIPDYNLL